MGLEAVLPPSEAKKPILEILYDGYYYDVTNWVKKHPGGGVINFYTHGDEDATIPIKEFHFRSDQKVMSIMKSLKRRKAENEDLKFRIPSRTKTKMMESTNEGLTADFMKLHNELYEEGLFKPSMLQVTLRISELLILLSAGAYFVRTQYFGLKILGAFCMALFASRGGLLGHEGGHKSMTGNPRIDKYLENLLMGLCIGLSGSFWSSQHNRHHAMPQRMKHDVDLQTLPLLAFNKSVVKNDKIGRSFWIRNQAYLFLTIDTLLITVLYKFYAHPRYALHKGLYGQLIIIICHYILCLTVLGPHLYWLAMWMGSIHLFGTFAMSHTHLPVTSDPGKHWVQYGLEHTMNVNPSFLCDWAMGYLNYQIEHHLFPTIPNFRLHRVAGRVKALAAKHNIKYHCVSYPQAIIKSLKNLNDVSKELNH